MDFKISAQLAQAIVNYLQTKPFGEVHELIKALIALEPLTPPDSDSSSS